MKRYDTNLFMLNSFATCQEIFKLHSKNMIFLHFINRLFANELFYELLKDLVFACLCINEPSTQQLKYEDSQRQAVCRYIVTFIQDDLRSHVFWSSTKRPSLLPQADFLCKTKIHLDNNRSNGSFYLVSEFSFITFSSNLEPLAAPPSKPVTVFRYQLGISTMIQYDVFRLQVSVDDSTAVEKSQSFDHTSSEEACGAVIKQTPKNKTTTGPEKSTMTIKT